MTIGCLLSLTLKQFPVLQFRMNSFHFGRNKITFWDSY